MIDRNHDLPITCHANLLGISRGSVYYLPRPVSDADLPLMRRIDELHLAHPFMGARMPRGQLNGDGIQVGRKHVGTLMQRIGIAALAPQARHEQARAGPQDLSVPAAQAGDHTAQSGVGAGHDYIPIARGFVYLTAVVNVYSRRVLAHKVAITLEACHAKEIIEQALAKYGTPEIFNTDQGSQFTAEEFTDVVLKARCKLSMDGRGAW